MGGKYLSKLYSYMPNALQNLFISSYNYLQYKIRYSGEYQKFRAQYKERNHLTLSQLKEIQLDKLNNLIQHALSKSPFYQKLYKDVELGKLKSISELSKFPIVDKEMIRANIKDIVTLPLNEARLSKTGGTTGKSLEVYKTVNDIRERMAILDNFRSKFGYELGKKTAWFSGKNLLTKRDLDKNRFWKTDIFSNIRYYSTFHIHPKFIKYYIEDLEKFKPEYMVGFPSTMYEIAKFGLKHNIKFKSSIKAIFPTAETLTQEIKEALENFFNAKVYDQYASSEGAPFIFECENRNLHLDLQTGVFEVLNENGEPSTEGRMLVTSFTSYGTPLIRYDIGDGLVLADRTCECGNNNPLVDQILGRINDYIYSAETGKINLGNVSNCLKGVHGIVKFQIIQDAINELDVYLVKDKIFNITDEDVFLTNLRDRVGEKMIIRINYCEDIVTEKSGKYRLIKNNIKNLI